MTFEQFIIAKFEKQVAYYEESIRPVQYLDEQWASDIKKAITKDYEPIDKDLMIFALKYKLKQHQLRVRYKA